MVSSRAGNPGAHPSAPFRRPVTLVSVNFVAALSRARYFEQEAFLNYLKYLQYWKEPRYARHLLYPQCLYFLDLLQDARFREVRGAEANPS